MAWIVGIDEAGYGPNLGPLVMTVVACQVQADAGDACLWRLLRSVPDPTDEQGSLYQIPGLPPDLAHLPTGCPFAPRCERAEDICRRDFPPFVQLTREHYSLCHFANEVYAASKQKHV